MSILAVAHWRSSRDAGRTVAALPGDFIHRFADELAARAGHWTVFAQDSSEYGILSARGSDEWLNALAAASCKCGIPDLVEEYSCLEPRFACLFDTVLCARLMQEHVFMPAAGRGQ